MKNEILAHLDEPGQLERLYQQNKAPFKMAFADLYPTLQGNLLAECWHERLHYESDDIRWGTGRDIVFVLLASLAAGLIAKIPAVFQVSEEFFYPRNIGFIFMPMLIGYFAWKNSLSRKNLLVLGMLLIACLVYSNLLPAPNTADTLVLACIHLPVVLWGLLGVAFVGNQLQDYKRRLDFLRFNGDLLVMTTIILIAGGIMAGLTIGLFALIGLRIEQFYFEYIAVFGLAAAPIVGTYLTHTNPQLVAKVSPVIAKIFSPLVLATLLFYLGAIIYSGKDPYNDREFLLLFNLLLIGVMALIFFSVAENTATEKQRMGTWVLLLLSGVTVVVNCIALSAIVFRIAEWGLTPNRLAVLGANALMLLHLLLITAALGKAVFSKAPLAAVGKSIALYLPVYIAWALIVVFLFPVLFGFK